jgi:hypothetical protein
MGYTHYWHRPEVIPAETFAAIRSDFDRLILPLADCGVLLAGPLGEDVPVITSDEIAFNGLRYCGHPANESLVIPYPNPDASGIGSSLNAIHDSADGLTTTIQHRCCNGRCSYETFRFSKHLQSDFEPTVDANGLCIEYVKTGFRPYDVAVTAALLIAKRNMQDRLMVHSDGSDSQWSDAKRICQKVLGYGDAFSIVEEQVKESTRMVTSRMLVEVRRPA